MDKQNKDFKEVLYQAKKQNMAIYEVPVDFSERMHGEAKGGAGSLRLRFKLIKRTLAYMMALKITL